MYANRIAAPLTFSLKAQLFLTVTSEPRIIEIEDNTKMTIGSRGEIELDRVEVKVDKVEI